MKTLIIVAHPDLRTSRIHRAWTEELREHDEFTVHSLYNVYPDGNIDVKREQALLDSHDRIIFQYPLYWYSTPQLLHHWFDEVLEPGWAFGPGGDHLRGKEIGIAISTAGTAASYHPEGYNLFPIREITKPVEALANHVHAAYLPLYVLHDSRNVTDAELRDSAEAYLKHLAASHPVAASVNA